MTALHPVRRSSESLVIAPQWVGDAVMTEPLLRRLHARGERLTVAALPWVAPIYQAMPQVSDIVELPFHHGRLQWRERRCVAKRLHGQFDTAYVCPNSLKSALLPFLAGIPKRVGYLGETRVGLLTHRLPNPRSRPPMVAFYSALSGDADVIEDRPRLQSPDADIEAVSTLFGLARCGYHVLVPGAEYGPAKRWPANRFAELALRLRCPVVLLGTAQESDVCAQIESLYHDETQPHPALHNLAGQTSLAQALCLIAGCRSMVSNDSGLMHVAAGLGVPQVAIFGSSSPFHTPPLNPRASVLWLKNDPTYSPPLDCSPCFERQCPMTHTRCLIDIDPEAVWQKLVAIDPPSLAPHNR